VSGSWSNFTSYSVSVAGVGTFGGSIPVVISGLTANTSYSWTATLSNSFGSASQSGGFTTGPPL
jgi:hypothetical protein